MRNFFFINISKYKGKSFLVNEESQRRHNMAYFYSLVIIIYYSIIHTILMPYSKTMVLISLLLSYRRQ